MVRNKNGLNFRNEKKNIIITDVNSSCWPYCLVVVFFFSIISLILDQTNTQQQHHHHNYDPKIGNE